MASELRVDTLKDASGNNSVGLSYVANGSAKAHAYLSDGGTESNTLNISGLTDDSSGRLTVTLSSPMSVTSDIVAFGTVQGDVSSGGDMANVVVLETGMTATVIKLAIGHSSDSTKDFDCSFLVHGDLA